MPFGGRDRELERLNEWLAKEEPRNLLITAPAGRGKTALLVRWAARIPKEWPVAFVPISIRFDTNRAAIFYQALAARLASLLDEVLPATPADPAIFYKDKVVEYFERFDGSNRRCLVIIDGLDEATGWDVDESLLPVRPPAGLRFVASARLAGDRGTAYWLRHLGWEFPPDAASLMEVPTLTENGIADVLNKMGISLAQLAQETDVIQELFRLTEHGDPLLLKFYVDDLWTQRGKIPRLTAKDLVNLKPGFVGYFEDWFERQRRAWQQAGVDYDEEATNVILALLACALGPIKLAELGELMSEMLQVRRFVSTETLSPIRRFVIGGGIQAGYALAHPKLAEFIQHQYFGRSRIVAEARRAFLAWCKGVVQRLNSEKPSEGALIDYCLRYYVQHLETLPDAPLSDYRDLVENGWRLAWLSRDEGLHGFARDMEVVWSRLLKEAQKNPCALKVPRTGLGGLLRCALVLSSIRSISAAVPPNFLAELVREDLVGPREALHLAALKSDGQQAATIEALAPYLGRYLVDAELQARGIKSINDRVVAFAAVAHQLSEPRRAELLAEASRMIETSADAHILDTYSLKRTRAKIEQYRLLPAGAKVGCISIAELVLPARHAQVARAPRARTPVSEPILAPQEARSLFASVVKEPIDWKAGERVDSVLCRLPESVIAEVLDAILRGTADSWFEEAVSAVAPYLSTDLRWRVVASIDASIGGGYRAHRALSSLVPYLSDEEFMKMIDHWARQSEFFARHALGLVLPSASSGLVQSLLSLVLGFTHFQSHEGLIALMPYLSTDQIDEVLTSVLEWGGFRRQIMLEDLAPLLSKEQRRRAAAAVSDQLDALDQLLPLIPEEERGQIIAGVYQRAYHVHDGLAVIAALTALARRSDDHEVSALFDAACRVELEVVHGASSALSKLVLSCFPGIEKQAARKLIAESAAISAQAGLDDRFLLQGALTLVPHISAVDAKASAAAILARADAALPGHVSEQVAHASAILLFSPHLSESTCSAAFDRLSDQLDKCRNAKHPNYEVIGRASLLASIAPRISPQQIVELSELTKFASHPFNPAYRLLSSALSALSPHITRECAMQAIVNSDLLKNATEYPSFRALISPYLDESMMCKSVVSILQSLPSTTREEVLATISIFEGGWFDFLGLFPALSDGKPAQNCLSVVGGATAVAETVEAVQATRAWWP